MRNDAGHSFGKTQTRSVLDVLVLVDQGVICIEIEVPPKSRVAGTAWIRISRGVAQWARQPSQVAPEIDGTDCVFVSGGAAVAPAQQEDSEPSIGRPIAFRSQTTPPLPPDRLHSGQPDSARLSIGRSIAFQSPKNEKDKSEPQDIPIGRRRWYLRNGLQRKKFARANDDLQRIHECFFRSELQVHDVDGAFQWQLVCRKVGKKAF